MKSSSDGLGGNSAKFSHYMVRVPYAYAQYVMGKCALYVGLRLLTIVYAHINIMLL